jgi:hypothetical protein
MSTSASKDFYADSTMGEIVRSVVISGLLLASRPCKPDDGGNQMKEKDDDMAHPGMVSKPKKHLILAQFSNSPWTGYHKAQTDRLSWTCKKHNRGTTGLSGSCPVLDFWP